MNKDKICKNLCHTQGGGPIYAKCATFPRHAGKGEPGLIANEAMEIVKTKILSQYYLARILKYIIRILS